MAIIIGIGHRSGQGKDTLAGYLIESLGILVPKARIVKMSWAWKLKDTCYQLYSHCGLRESEFYETEEGRALRNIKLSKIDLTPVEIWIKYGSYGVRDQVWDKTWVEWLYNNNDADIIVAPDTRFPVESPYCEYLIHCHDPRVPNRVGVTVDDELEGFKGWNYQVVNDGTKVQLGKKAIQLSRVVYESLQLRGFL